jgi:predicted RNA binding protein YcfA (HicA-like mRNA interferase family)
VKSVSGKHLCKILEKQGWTLQRIHGSHHIFGKSGDPVIITVPVHRNRDLKRGTQRQIMKSAGLSDSDL